MAIESKSKHPSKESVRSILRRLDQIDELAKAVRFLLSGGFTLGNREWMVLNVFERMPDAWLSPTVVSSEFQFVIKAEEVAEIIGELVRLKLVKRKKSRGRFVFSLNGPAGRKQGSRPAPRADDPMLCDHPNEAPNVCPCAPGCYCKTRTCAPVRKGRRP
jgi:hypothetical protein